MSFSQGVSGLNAAASNLDVIGNNIANSGTVGFKSGAAVFADVYAGSRVGLGTKVAAVSQNFSQGSLQSSTRPLDVGIANGDGFFRMSSASGEVSYSRNGQFTKDKDGFLVNSAGLMVTGYQVSANGTIAGGSPTALQLPNTAMAPNATTAIASSYTIDSRSTVPTTAPFDETNPDTYNYANAVTIYDSLGNPHELTTFFVKTGSNAWDAYATADGWPLTATGAMVPDANVDGIPDAGASALSGLTFNTVGALTAPANGTVNFALLDFNNGSALMNFDMDFTGTTQVANNNSVNTLTQDGYTAGSLIGFEIGQDGIITGKYSNEQINTLGQIVLSSFPNPNGLLPKGDNVWGETAASGQPLIGTPGSGTKVGALVSGTLESSNVDLTGELVNLIVAQRTYQANAQTVQAQSQVMQTLVNMR